MNGFFNTIGMVILLAFLMVACEPQSTGEAIRTFIDAAQGQKE